MTNSRLFCTQIILGLITIGAAVGSIFFSDQRTQLGLYVLILVSLALLAFSMMYNYTYEKKVNTQSHEDQSWKIETRNSWDIWFFLAPAAILALLFVGVLASSKDVWVLIATALGGVLAVHTVVRALGERR